MARHLIWDWNGTLLNDARLVVAATNDALRVLGGPEIGFSEYRSTFYRPVIDYYSGVLGWKLSAAEFTILNTAFHDNYRRRLATVGLTEHARSALEFWRSWGGSQSLLSMSPHHELVPAVEKHGLAEYFERVDGVLLDVRGAEKAGHLAAHLAMLDVDGTDCALVGDTPDDVVAAAAVGARALLYSGGVSDPATLRRCGVPLVDSLIDAVRLVADG